MITSATDAPTGLRSEASPERIDNAVERNARASDVRNVPALLHVIVDNGRPVRLNHPGPTLIGDNSRMRLQRTDLILNDAWIDGARGAESTGRTFAVTNPADDSEIARPPDCG